MATENGSNPQTLVALDIDDDRLRMMRLIAMIIETFLSSGMERQVGACNRSSFCDDELSVDRRI